MIRMNVGFVPVEQILAGDGCDGGILRLARIGIVGTVGQFAGFARSNCSDLIIASRDAVVGLLLCEVELVGTEFGILQQIGEDFENIVEIALQTRQADGGRVRAAAGFYFSGTHLQEVVELVSGLRLSAACAPDFSKDANQPNFGSRLAA